MADEFVIRRMWPRIIVDTRRLSELSQSDITQCFCSIHRVPDTYDVAFSERGCCKEPAGRAAVVAAAFNRVSRTCHADEATRVKDKRFLQLIMRSGNDPGVLDGRSRPSQMRQFCTSSSTTTLRAFGNGYCYLELVEKDLWWRVARLLGPNPALVDFLRLYLWVGRAVGKRYRLIPVKAGYYHFEAVSSRSDRGAGAFNYDEIASVVSRELTLGRRDARVG